MLMVLPDVNICIAAFRTDHPNHLSCRRWLTNAYVNETRVGISSQVLSGLVRITTHPGFMSGCPSTLAEALDFGDVLLQHPKTVSVHPTPGHWKTFASLCRGSGARGKLVADAWLAALAIEHGCTWITLDQDFGRFSGLRWAMP